MVSLNLRPRTSSPPNSSVVLQQLNDPVTGTTTTTTTTTKKAPLTLDLNYDNLSTERGAAANVNNIIIHDFIDSPITPLHHDPTEEEFHSLLSKSSSTKLNNDHDDDSETDSEQLGDQLTMIRSDTTTNKFTLNKSHPSSSSIPLSSSSRRMELRHKRSTSGLSTTSWNSEKHRTSLIREMIVQTFPALVFCMITALIAGELLEHMQMWGVFIRIEELFILVPILLNLKGNLEMNLAARFSTSANIGELDLRPTRRALILGNLALLQVQALIVSFVSGLLAFILGILSRSGIQHPLQHPTHKNNEAEHLRGGYFEALLVLCVSMLAASFSSAILGNFMCSLVVVCRRFRINPDNLATPLASALGDMVTLVLLGGLASLFSLFIGTLISTLVFILLLVAIFVNVVITFRNTYVQELLTVGWAPLFIAMTISSGSGLVLETYVNRFKGFALFAPVFTALSGSAGAIFVSRISTALHSSTFDREPYRIVGFALFLITTPVVLVLLPFAWLTDQVQLSWGFVGGFFLATIVQMIISLILAYYIATLLWKFDYDPDVYALPLLSSILDVTGQLCLVLAFTLAVGEGRAGFKDG